jgi:hypothetical protein
MTGKIESSTTTKPTPASIYTAEAILRNMFTVGIKDFLKQIEDANCRSLVVLVRTADELNAELLMVTRLVCTCKQFGQLRARLAPAGKKIEELSRETLQVIRDTVEGVRAVVNALAAEIDVTTLKGARRVVGALDSPMGKWLPPLHAAAYRNDVTALTRLAERGANLNAVCAIQVRHQVPHTPLDYAGMNYKKDTVLHLLSLRADASIGCGEPMYQAVYRRDRDMVEELLKAKAEPNMPCQKHHGARPLSKAVSKTAVDIVELFLQYKADPNGCEPNASTALHHAVTGKTVGRQQVDIVTMLLAAKASVNQPNSNGETPLQLAVRRGYGDDDQRTVMRLLADAQAQQHEVDSGDRKESAAGR